MSIRADARRQASTRRAGPVPWGLPATISEEAPQGTTPRRLAPPLEPGSRLPERTLPAPAGGPLRTADSWTPHPERSRGVRRTPPHPKRHAGPHARIHSTTGAQPPPAARHKGTPATLRPGPGIPLFVSAATCLQWTTRADDQQGKTRWENAPYGSGRRQYRGTEWSICSDHASIPPLTDFTYLNPCWRRYSNAFIERFPALQ